MYMYQYVCMYQYVSVCISMYVCMYVCMYACMCIHIYCVYKNNLLTHTFYLICMMMSSHDPFAFAPFGFRNRPPLNARDLRGINNQLSQMAKNGCTCLDNMYV
mgnify:CR=1 FL=1